MLRNPGYRRVEASDGVDGGEDGPGRVEGAVGRVRYGQIWDLGFQGVRDYDERMEY